MQFGTKICKIMLLTWPSHLLFSLAFTWKTIFLSSKLITCATYLVAEDLGFLEFVTRNTAMLEVESRLYF